MNTPYTTEQLYRLGHEAGSAANMLPDEQRIGVRADVELQRVTLRDLNLGAPWHQGFLDALNGALPCGCIGCCEGAHLGAVEPCDVPDDGDMADTDR